MPAQFSTIIKITAFIKETFKKNLKIQLIFLSAFFAKL